MSRWILVAAACGLWSCGKCSSEPKFEESQSPAERAAEDSAAATDAGPLDSGNPHNVVVKPDVRPGWEHEDLDDVVPVCIFSDYDERNRADFIEKVRPQRLSADAGVVFGAYGPRCLHRDCDDSPTLQAWFDQSEDGRVFEVHSKYTGEHKTGAKCDECEVVIAGAETPQLAPGTYTVKYGDKTRVFQVPSTLAQPCIGSELKRPPAARKK